MELMANRAVPPISITRLVSALFYPQNSLKVGPATCRMGSSVCRAACRAVLLGLLIATRLAKPIKVNGSDVDEHLQSP